MSSLDITDFKKHFICNINCAKEHKGEDYHCEKDGDEWKCKKGCARDEHCTSAKYCVDKKCVCKPANPNSCKTDENCGKPAGMNSALSSECKDGCCQMYTPG